MEEVYTKPILLDRIAEYACGWGERTMAEICTSLDETYQQMTIDQDAWSAPACVRYRAYTTFKKEHAHT